MDILKTHHFFYCHMFFRMITRGDVEIKYSNPFWIHVWYIYIYTYRYHKNQLNVGVYIPGTQITLVLIGKGLLLEGLSPKIEDKQVHTWILWENIQFLKKFHEKCGKICFCFLRRQWIIGLSTSSPSQAIRSPLAKR